MNDHFGYLHANVHGMDTETVPEGMLALPTGNIRTINTNFYGRNAIFQHGMYMCHVNQDPSFYLRACSRRQTAVTSSAPATCIQADVRKLKPEEFHDDMLDQLLSFQFASEIDIVRGEVQDGFSHMVVPIQESLLHPAISHALMSGCFARWVKMSDPLFVALSDSEFEEKVLSVLKSIYNVMPYSLRAHAGHITYPDPKVVLPEFVSLCFFPESWRNQYPNKPILTLDPNQCQPAIDEIERRSSLPTNLLRYVDFSIKTTAIMRVEWHEFLAKVVEGDGNVDMFARTNPKAYGDAFVIKHDWELMTPAEKDDFALKQCDQPKTVLTEITWQLIATHMDAARLRYMVYERAGACTEFRDFISRVKPLYPLVERLDVLSNAWNSSLLSFTMAILNHLSIQEEWTSVRSQLGTMFNHSTLLDCEQRISLEHQRQVTEELNAITAEINQEFWQPIAEALPGLVAAQARVQYAENVVSVRKFAVDNAVSVFQRACSADARCSRYEELRDLYDRYTARSGVLWSSELAAVWNEYETRHDDYERAWEDITAYLAGVMVGKDFDLNPQWQMSKYSTNFLALIHTCKKEDPGMAQVWEKAFDDWRRMSAGPVEFQEIVPWDDATISGIYRRCCELSVLGDEQVTVRLPLDASNARCDYVPLSSVKALVYWLITGEEQPLLYDDQMWLAVALARNRMLRVKEIERLLAATNKGQYLEQLVIIAGVSCVLGYRFKGRSRGSSGEALAVLAQTRNIANDDIIRNKDSFLHVGDNEQERRKLQGVWDRVIERRPQTAEPAEGITSILTSSSKNTTVQPDSAATMADDFDPSASRRTIFSSARFQRNRWVALAIALVAVIAVVLLILWLSNLKGTDRSIVVPSSSMSGSPSASVVSSAPPEPEISSASPVEEASSSSATESATTTNLTPTPPLSDAELRQGALDTAASAVSAYVDGDQAALDKMLAPGVKITATKQAATPTTASTSIPGRPTVQGNTAKMMQITVRVPTTYGNFTVKVTRQDAGSSWLVLSIQPPKK